VAFFFFLRINSIIIYEIYRFILKLRDYGPNFPSFGGLLIGLHGPHFDINHKKSLTDMSVSNSVHGTSARSVQCEKKKKERKKTMHKDIRGCKVNKVTEYS
jgi:hypothetical protein